MSDRIAFLDTNVLLRHIMQVHSDHSTRSTALMAAIEQGQRTVQIADTVVFETAYTLEKTYGMPREVIRTVLQRFVELPSVLLSGKTIFAGVFELYVRNHGLSIADCYHAEMAKRFTGGFILSFDQRLGTVDGITREEP
jgi:predicted nucleic acid-binding protein